MPPRKSGGIGKTTGEMNGIPVLLTVDVSRCNLLQHNALRGCTTCMSEAVTRSCDFVSDKSRHSLVARSYCCTAAVN